MLARPEELGKGRARSPAAVWDGAGTSVVGAARARRGAWGDEVESILSGAPLVEPNIERLVAAVLDGFQRKLQAERPAPSSRVPEPRPGREPSPPASSLPPSRVEPVNEQEIVYSAASVDELLALRKAGTSAAVPAAAPSRPLARPERRVAAKAAHGAAATGTELRHAHGKALEASRLAGSLREVAASCPPDSRLALLLERSADVLQSLFAWSCESLKLPVSVPVLEALDAALEDHPGDTPAFALVEDAEEISVPVGVSPLVRFIVLELALGILEVRPPSAQSEVPLRLVSRPDGFDLLVEGMGPEEEGFLESWSFLMRHHLTRLGIEIWSTREGPILSRAQGAGGDPTVGAPSPGDGAGRARPGARTLASDPLGASLAPQTFGLSFPGSLGALAVVLVPTRFGVAAVPEHQWSIMSVGDPSKGGFEVPGRGGFAPFRLLTGPVLRREEVVVSLSALEDGKTQTSGVCVAKTGLETFPILWMSPVNAGGAPSRPGGAPA